MSEIIYRKLEWNDIDRFIELRKSQLIEEGGKVVSDITSDLFDFYKKHMEDGTFVSYVATVNNDIIATSGMSFVEKPPYFSNPTGQFGIVSSMYTIPAYRRNGIAKKLLGLVMDEAREYGCSVVQITTTDTGAYFYQDFGFKRNTNFFQYNFNEWK